MRIEEENKKQYKVVCYGIETNDFCLLSYGDTKREAIEEYIKDINKNIRIATDNLEVFNREKEHALAELKKCE